MFCYYVNKQGQVHPGVVFENKKIFFATMYFKLPNLSMNHESGNTILGGIGHLTYSSEYFVKFYIIIYKGVDNGV